VNFQVGDADSPSTMVTVVEEWPETREVQNNSGKILKNDLKKCISQVFDKGLEDEGTRTNDATWTVEVE
jgi:hypothetical protein